jgi:hypothetical protein
MLGAKLRRHRTERPLPPFGHLPPLRGGREQSAPLRRSDTSLEREYFTACGASAWANAKASAGVQVQRPLTGRDEGVARAGDVRLVAAIARRTRLERYATLAALEHARHLAVAHVDHRGSKA